MLRELEQWLKSFDRATFYRGTTYAENGFAKVELKGPDSITARVRGSRGKIYDVGIETLKSGQISAFCTCPIGHRCKHIVAAALNALSSQDSNAMIAKTAEFSIEEVAWLENLAKDVPATERIPTATTFIYVLAQATYDPLHVQIEFYTSRLKKTGGFSSSPPTRYDLDDVLRCFPDKLRAMLTGDDWEILSLLWQQKTRASPHSLSILKKIVETGRCYYGMSWLRPLIWAEDREGSFGWEYNSDGTQTIRLRGAEAGIKCFLAEEEGFYIHAERGLCGSLKLPCKIETARKLLKSPQVSEKNLPKIQQKLAEIVQNVPIAQKIVIEVPKSSPKPHFSVSAKRTWNHCEIMSGQLFFRYGEHQLPFNPNTAKKIGLQKENALYWIERELKTEEEALRALVKFGWKIASDRQFYYSRADNLEEDALDFVTLFISKMEPKGWTFSFDSSFPIQSVLEPDDWYAEVSENQENWFDLELGPIVDGNRVNLIPALRRFLLGLDAEGFSFDQLTPEQLQKKIPLPIKQGELLMISLSRLKTIFDAFLGILNQSEDVEKVRFSQWEIPQLDHLEELGKLQWQTPENYQKMQGRFKSFGKIALIKAPEELHCELRTYQLEGISWLQFLRSCDLGGVLADDMGLGKTVQTLAHILIEKSSGRMRAPALVVAPTTLMGNWFTEAERFAPQLKVLILQGNDRKKRFDEVEKCDLVLTTYPLLARDREILQKHPFHLLILDEAQNIKNAKTHAHKVIRGIQANHRLCLTGTPMENHLGELWSLFHILLPGFLGDEKQFQKLFRKPIEKEGSLERKKILQKRIAPFMLRRTKQQVISELPPKTEILTPIELTQKQRDLYEAVRLTMMQKVLSQVEEKGLARSRIVLLDALLKLRQICCDPRLLKTAKDVELTDSAKLLYLRTSILQMISEKRQILLFSQFTSMLELIERELHRLNIPYTMITGNTKNRLEPVQTFQAKEVPLMLISLKAGGTGLNLTAADTVIHYDPWWNPAIENQATDRAHRMGQTNPVFVYKLIASGSVEEKILRLQKKKQELVTGLFDESNTKPLEMDLGELQSLFEPLDSVVTRFPPREQCT